jgi:homocysteine S-methyltransferase
MALTCLGSAQGILNRKVLLLDGGLGTTLEDQHNVKFSSEETPLWSSHLLVSSPETLLKVQTAFAKAGADILLTATYQASYDGMGKTPMIAHWKHEKHPRYPPPEAKALLTSAVSISKNAVKQNGRPALIALSLGAYGATLIPSQEYTGDYGEIDRASLHGFHQHRLDAFIQDDEAWNNIDIIAFETLPTLGEIIAVRDVMQTCQDIVDGRRDGYISKDRKFETKPFWISCVFPNDNDELPDGSSIDLVLKAMLRKIPLRPRPYAIGINCTKVQKISRLVRNFEDAYHKLGEGYFTLPRLVIYPDGAGDRVYDTKTQKWVGDQSEGVPWDQQMFGLVKEIQQRGKWEGILVGGCCKTTPEHIAKLRMRMDEWVGEATHAEG